MSSTSKGAAIVTGAAQGIGKAIAIRLARDGYDVAVNDVQGKEEALKEVVEEVVSAGRKGISVVADITNEESVVGLVERCVSELGILRVMVANAGISLTFGTSCVDLRLEDFEKVLKVNLVGVFLCYREAARQMVKQNSWGRIIGASSILGRSGKSLSTGYAASKFGIRGITQCLAAEMFAHGITVNAYAPGLIDSPMTRGTLIKQNLTEEEMIQKMTELVSSATNTKLTVGGPQDVANVVSFLASEESKFMTGQTMSIDGGAYFG